MRELCCYLLIPELPLEHRSGSVSRSAPCTGTVQPADRKARLASHKEANIEEHFLSQRGFVRRTRSNPLSWQGTVTNTHTHWLAHLGECMMDWDLVSPTHVLARIPTYYMTRIHSISHVSKYIHPFFNGKETFIFVLLLKHNCLMDMESNKVYIFQRILAVFQRKRWVCLDWPQPCACCLRSDNGM